MFEFITNFLEKSGYLGVFVLMAAENIFPPIPSELIMPFAGFVAARGDLSLIGVLLAGTAGTVAGVVPWYWAARKYGKERLKAFTERHSRWTTVGCEDIDKAIAAFDRHGRSAVLFGRLIPAIRTLISVPAGLACMSWTRFLLYSTIGSLVWTGVLTGAGYVLESNYEQVSRYVDPVSKGILGILVAWYLYRVITHRKSKD